MTSPGIYENLPIVNRLVARIVIRATRVEDDLSGGRYPRVDRMIDLLLSQSENPASSISPVAKANTAVTVSASGAISSHPLRSRKT